MPRRLIVALVVGLSFAACGGNDREDAEQTVRDFVRATNERDEDAYCEELVTLEFLEQTTGATGERARNECKDQIKALTGVELDLLGVDKVEVDGDTAKVTATIQTQGVARKQVLMLEKEEGDWRLAGGSGG